MEDFVHLHVHRQYSILDGQSKIPRLVDKAIKDGMKGMAVTDHGVMFGIKELVDYCGKVNKDRQEEGARTPQAHYRLRDVCGTTHQGRHARRRRAICSGYHLIVLAKNYNGYKTSSSW